MRARRLYAVGPLLASLLAIVGVWTPTPRSPAATIGGAPRTTRPPVSRAPASVTAFVNVNLVPMDSERVLTQQTVLVEGGRITALGAAGKIKVPAGAVRIDGRGQYLIPGLADMHAHLHFTDDRSYAGIHVDSVMVEKRLFRSWLANGVTAIRNLDRNERSYGERALRVKARVAAGELLSPRIYTSGPWYGTDGLSPNLGMAPERVAELIAGYKAAGYDHLKIYEEHGEFFHIVAAAARRVELPLVGHLPKDQPKQGKYNLEWGLTAMRSIDHLFLFKVLYKTPSPDTSELRATAVAIQRAGVWVTPTLTIDMRLGRMSNPAVVTAIRQFLKALQETGPGLLLGTDDALAEPITVQDELQALVQVGLTPYQALVTGTRNPAAYFNALDSTGTIAVGKRADLVLLSGNPLDDIRNTARPVGVMVRGRWLSREELDQRLAAFP